MRACATLALVTFADGSKVTSAEEVPANGSTPAYCSVSVLVLERINILVLLPKTNWNGRYQAVGNGVYAGVALPPTGAVAQGYAASSTDTGHQSALLTGEWAWSPTGMNYSQIQDFAYRANHEMAVKSKALIEYYYGRGPTLAYWNGCSTGGREGLTEAARYPDDFDGILAAAPAINWTRFIPAEEWPQVVMKELGNFLPSCKAEALTAIVTDACDQSDGLRDGLFDSRYCAFDPGSLVGVQTPCGAFTQADATVIEKIWQGPRRPNGGFLWYGLERGASLTSLAGTVETPAGRDGNPFLVSNEWFKWFLHKDPTWDWHTLTFDSFAVDFDQSVTEWADVLGTNDPNLSAFRARGGKLVIWHGLADPLIFPRGTTDYYDRVVAAMGGPGATRGFARLFLAPNVGHCSGGAGPNPVNPFDVVVKWREQGIAPDTLLARLGPGQGVNNTNEEMTRPLCPYPEVARYRGSGSIYKAENFTCAVNLAPDPDFEASPFASYFTDGPGAFSWASDQARSGSHSLKIVSSTMSLSRWLSVTNAIAATPGAQYSACVYLKTMNVGTPAYLSVNYWTSSSVYIPATVDSATKLGGTTDWTEVCVASTAPAGAAFLRVEFRLPDTGTLWADDVSVTSP